MPFMKGRAALRRTLDWLESGNILFRDNIKIVTFNYAPVVDNEVQPSEHAGLYKFIFWHLPQLKYKNPNVQLITFKNITPTPWIRAYMDDEAEMLIDCDSRSREEIHDHVQSVLGKTSEMLEFEKTQEESIKANPANFGWVSTRQCMCEVPGQIPCTGFVKLPKMLLGKHKIKVTLGESTVDEIMAAEMQPLKAEYDNEIRSLLWKRANKHTFT